MTAEFGPWLEVVTSLGFAGLAWWLVTRSMPEMVREFRSELHEQRARFSDVLLRQREDHRIMLHDAYVREKQSREELLETLKELRVAINGGSADSSRTTP